MRPTRLLPVLVENALPPEGTRSSRLSPYAPRFTPPPRVSLEFAYIPSNVQTVVHRPATSHTHPHAPTLCASRTHARIPRLVAHGSPDLRKQPTVAFKQLLPSSALTLEHLADSLSGPFGCSGNQERHCYKVQNP